MPAIRSMTAKPYSEISAQAICDIMLICPQCKKTTEINATKQIIDNHKLGIHKITCNSCGWATKFYVEYHKAIEKNESDAYIISDVPLLDKWWLNEDGVS